MPDDRSIIYWDACVFLSYINEIPERMPVIDALLASSASDSGTIRLYTSALSKIEVSFAVTEQNQRALDPEVERRIDNFWSDPEVIVLVDFHDGIGDIARDLMRTAVVQGWSLKPLDAVHLATAKWMISVGVNVTEFHTYDAGLFKYASTVGCSILVPYTPQPNLL